MNKLIAFLLVTLAVVMIPRLSVSKDTQSDTIILGSSNLLVLNGEVNGESTSAVIAKAKELCENSKNTLSKKIGLAKPETRLKLFMNTPGGGIQAGLEMSEALNGLGCPVDTITLFAASMGFQLVQNLGDRLILKNGVLMSHHAAGEFEGSFGGIHPSQVDSRYQLWLDRVRELDEQTVKRTNGKQTYESYTTQYDHELWLTGTKAIEQGYADRIVTVRCDSSLNGVTTKHATVMGLPVAYDLDNCPINTSPMNVRVENPDNKEPLTAELLAEVKSKFLTQFNNKQKQVLPLLF